MFRERQFVGIWIMFYLNIHCGLMIISYEKQLLSTAFAAAAALGTIVSVVPSFTAAFNALGRIGYSTLSDSLSQRNTIYKVIFISCIAITMAAYLTHSVSGATTPVLAAIVLLFLFIINAGYGGGFSTLPALLSERFGMERISQIHGLALSAWAIAGLTGNNTSELILSRTGMYENLLLVCALLYAVALVVCIAVVGSRERVS
jgi:OFA family oxalate/formate antiporter-like MFS transporter